jgi:nucleoid-associated protein EbfC
MVNYWNNSGDIVNRGGMGGLMKQAQNMKKKMADLQHKMAEQTVESEAGDGAVCVTATCRQTLKSIQIKPEACEDIEVLEDLIITAVNRAMVKGQNAYETKMSKLTGGINLPFGI